jgi:hypothetical protein
MMELLLTVVKYGLLIVIAVEAVVIGRALLQVVVRREPPVSTQE